MNPGTGSVFSSPNKWFFGNNGSSFRACHENANAIDAAYPAKQYWNTKTPW